MKESHMRTKLAHTGDLELAKKIQSSVSVPKVLPIYMSSVFTFDDVPSLDAVYAGEADGYVYSRMTNPSTDAAEEMLAAAEGADGALVFSSGMAAIINAIIANVQAGDHIVSSPVLYGGVYDPHLLARRARTDHPVPVRGWHDRHGPCQMGTDVFHAPQGYFPRQRVRPVADFRSNSRYVF